MKITRGVVIKYSPNEKQMQWTHSLQLVPKHTRTYILVHVRTYTHAHAPTHTQPSACAQTHTHVHTRAPTYLHARARTHPHTAHALRLNIPPSSLARELKADSSQVIPVSQTIAPTQVSNPRRRMLMSAAQHKTVNLLKTFILLTGFC